VRCWC